MKRVLLISPPVRNQRPADMLPIGLLSIAGYLRKYGLAAKVHNSCFPGHDAYGKKVENTIKHIKEYAPDFIGIGFPSDALDPAIEIAQAAKDLNKEVKVIVGGIHPSAEPAETMGIPYFDFLVQGEGEITTKELLEAATAKYDFTEVTGISYKRDGTILNNEPRPEISDLDSIPFDNRDLLFDVETYPKAALGQIHTSRGCPYRCAYCSSSIIWKKNVRYRSVENVMAEIEYLNSCYHVKDINFADDNFTLDRDRVADICEEILKRKLKLHWRCCSRPDIHHSFNSEILRLMHRAGCKQLCIGFESGDQGLLDSASRGVKISENDRVLEVVKNAGIRLHADFIIGLPGENKETLNQTLQLMKRVWHQCRPTMNVALFKPYPGTRLCESGVADHVHLHQEYKKIFAFAESCNIKRLSQNPAFIGRKLLDNIAAPKKVGALVRRTLGSLKSI